MVVITELDLPQMDVGAPNTHLFMNGNDQLVLLYYVQTETENFIPFGIVFAGAASYKHGYPNDEGLHSHPLYEHGLRHYAVYEVGESPWIKELNDMKLVTYSEEYLSSRPPTRHLVWTFKEGTFEVACLGLDQLTFAEAERAWSTVAELDPVVIPNQEKRRQRLIHLYEQGSKGRWENTSSDSAGP